MWSKIQNNKIMKAIIGFLQSKWFIPVPFVLSCISNFFGLELVVYTIMIAIAVFTLVFCKSAKPIVPVAIATYFATSRNNSPIVNPDGYLYAQPFAQKYIIALGFIVAVAFFARIFIQKEYDKVRFKNYNLIGGMSLLFFAFIFSGFLNPENSLRNILFGTLIFISIALFYFYLSTSVDWKEVDRLYLPYVMLSMALLLIVQLLYLYATVDEIVLKGVIFKSQIVTGWGIQNNIGGMLVITLPFIFYLCCKAKRGYIYLLVSLAVFASTALTLSRTALVVAVPVMIVGFILSCLKSPSRKINIIITSCLPFLAAIAFLCYYDKIIIAFQTMLSNGANLSGRDTLYKAGLKMFADYPVFGTGFYSISPELDVYDIFVPGRYHNVVVQFMASCGVIGLIAFIVHTAEAFRLSLKRLNAYRFTIFCFIVTLLGISMFDNHYFNFGPGIIYSIILAFLQADFRSSVPTEEQPLYSAMVKSLRLRVAYVKAKRSGQPVDEFYVKKQKRSKRAAVSTVDSEAKLAAQGDNIAVAPAEHAPKSLSTQEDANKSGQADGTEANAASPADNESCADNGG